MHGAAHCSPGHRCGKLPALGSLSASLKFIPHQKPPRLPVVLQRCGVGSWGARGNLARVCVGPCGSIPPAQPDSQAREGHPGGPTSPALCAQVRGAAARALGPTDRLWTTGLYRWGPQDSLWGYGFSCSLCLPQPRPHSGVLRGGPHCGCSDREGAEGEGT